MELPFKETQLSDDHVIRTFKADVESNDLAWHLDREDRLVQSVGKTNWKLQLENQLPTDLDQPILIRLDTWHRLIKGEGDLTIKITKGDAIKQRS